MVLNIIIADHFSHDETHKITISIEFRPKSPLFDIVLKKWQIRDFWKSTLFDPFSQSWRGPLFGVLSVCGFCLIETLGSYKCACVDGYFEDDFGQCQNPCQRSGLPCSESASCKNVTNNEFRCLCDSGYIGDGHYCEDLNECESIETPCKNNKTCINTVGSYKCKKQLTTNTTNFKR